MAIQPEILFRRRPIDLPSPIETATRGLGLRNLVMQTQAAQMGLDEKQAAMDRAKRVRAVLMDHYANGGKDDETLYQKIAQVDPSAAAALEEQHQKIVEFRTKQQKDKADIAKTEGETQKTAEELRTSRLRYLLTALPGMKPESLPGAYGQARKDLSAVLGSDAPADLAAFEEQVGMPFADYLTSKVGPIERKTKVVGDVLVDDQTGKPVYTPPSANAPKSIGSYTNEKGEHVQIMQTPDGTLTQKIVGKEGLTPFQQKSLDLQASGQAETGRHNRAMEAKDAPVEIKFDDKNYKVATDLAYGKLTFNDFNRLYGRSGASSNLKTAIYEKARELNPNFNVAAFEMGFKLASNPQVRQQLSSMDNVIAAVPDLLQLSEAATRTGITKLNDLIIRGGIQVGNKHYANLETARVAFADELSGALGFGSATDMSRQMGIDMTRPDLAPETFRSQVEDVIVPFINRKKKSLLDEMGVYGTPEMHGGASNFAIDVGGKTFTFPDAKSLEGFKRELGIK